MEAGPDITAPRLMPAGEMDGRFTARDGAQLGMSSWEAEHPRAVVVAFHGMNDYARFIRGPAAYWREKGISTYAIDQRGFGRSPNTGVWAGDETMMHDFRDFTAAVHAAHPGVPLYILGESMGGAVTLASLSQPGVPQPKGVILVAPAVWGWSTMNPFYKAALWIAAHLLPGKKMTGGDLTILPSDNNEALDDLGADPLVIKPTRTDAIYGLVGLMDRAIKNAPNVQAPLLVLYGQRDEIVPRKPVEKLVASLSSSARVVLYPKGYHLLMRDTSREMVWNDVLAFIDGKSGPAPSGYEFKREDFMRGKIWPQPAKLAEATH
jgi:alpha-beta hydrolase superfamily lysophospholipase